MPEQLPQKNIHGLRTYSSDMADEIRTNETSVIKIALAEQKKRESKIQEQKIEGTKTSRVLFFVGGFIFIAVAIVLTIYALYQKEISDTAPIVTKKEGALVSYDTSHTITVSDTTTKKELLAQIEDATSTAKTAGTLTALFFTQNNQTLTLGHITSLLGIRIERELFQSLDLPYMIGSYTYTHESGAPTDERFILLTTKDFTTTYASLLDFEKTLIDDTWEFFGITLLKNNISLSSTEWVDTRIKNKDARVLSYADGTPALIYMFIDRETLIITPRSDTINEILLRIMTKNAKPLSLQRVPMVIQ